MSAGQITQGRRITQEQAWSPEARPGDYWKKGEGIWGIWPPGMKEAARISKHTITEHEDGTITVSPSILFDSPDYKWHGYLERGVWREV